jgi:hypothetical protein
MSKLLEKSRFNLDAAGLLIKEGLYAPSVHCSYYSCFQRVKSIFPDYFGISYSQIDLNVASSKTSEHNYLIHYISEQILQKIGCIEYRKFSNAIKDLKEFRTKSDYKDIEVSTDLSTKALSIAVEINHFLDQQF